MKRKIFLKNWDLKGTCKLINEKKKKKSEVLRAIIVGHVDHGKSSLIGKLISDLDQVQKEKVEEIKKICKLRGVKFEWAFLLDALKTERDQGITIDTTQIFFKTKKRNFVFIDAPGHKEFLQNMITGATTADLAFLIIDVNEGVKEQTKKHIYLLNLIGVRNVMVLVNKMDLVEYSQLKFEEIKKKINVYISKIGIQAINIVPISATKGDNIVKKSKYMPWYKKQTVIQSLESIEILNLSAELPLRIPVQDIYKINNKRIIVGRIESGNLDANQKILFSPSNTVVNLKKVEKWKDKSKTKYQAGECIGLVLEEEVFAEKGNLISDVQKPPTITNNFNARIFWFSNRSLVINNKYKLKLNTCDYEVSFLKILRVIETESLREKKTLNVEKNDVADVTIYSTNLVSIDDFSTNYKIGCFSIIDNFEVVGGGIISTYNEQNCDLDDKKILKNIRTEEFSVNEVDRVLKSGHRPGIIWLTGLSGSGKSTLAKEVEKKLFSKGYNIFILDGDNLRHGLNKDLTFSTEDRIENIRRTAEVASLFSSAGFIIITSLISPYLSERKKARAIKPEIFREVFVKASLKECLKRDVKGLYAKAKAGVIKNFTGLTAPYQEPHNPDLIIQTDKETIKQSVGKLSKYIEKEFGKDKKKYWQNIF